MRHLLATAATALCLVAASADAQPSPPCDDFDKITKHLHEKYDEAPVALGLQTNGNVLTVYSSVERDTFTILSTRPDGMSCIVAAGKGWEMLHQLVGQES